MRPADPSRDLLDGEPWSEPIEDLFNAGSHGAEIVDHERMFRVAQRYVDGLAALHLHLRVRPGGIDQDPCEFCAVVAGGLPAERKTTNFSYVTDPPGPPGEEVRIG